MVQDPKFQRTNVSLSQPSSKDLMGRQSVRATFKLTTKAIEALSTVSFHLGIKQKSVFDHLLEDVQALKEMARGFDDADYNPQERIQKTFVINRRSLSYLDTISSKHNTPRDALVEYSVRRLLPIIANERKNHNKRKELLIEISNHFESGKTLLSKVEKTLSREDPIVHKFKTAMNAYQNALDDMVGFMEKGKMIEEFQVD